jgi:uncharacterized protein (TIGR02466 family)
MKKKVKRSFPKKLNKIAAFPEQLAREELFRSPVWVGYAPGFVDKYNKAVDPYVERIKKAMKKEIDARNKKFGNKGDRGYVYQTTSLIKDPNFSEIQNYIMATSHNLLTEMGFDLKDYQIFMTEMWVQDFAKKGGGTQVTHSHWNGHISGFYFLKCSEATPKPVFADPRPGCLMNLLPEKDINKITHASSQIHYKIKPGTIVFSSSALPHMYPVDMGYEPFRFMHFNCQAIPKGAINVR